MGSPRILPLELMPLPEVCREVAAVLDRGGIVALPTDTIYGLSCRADNPAALARIQAIKGRDIYKGLILLIDSPGDVLQLVREVPAAAIELMDRYWPGPLTLLFAGRPTLEPQVVGEEGTVAIRCPGNAFLQTLLRSVGAPVTSTSANYAGQPPLTTPLEIAAAFGDQIDLIVDGGAPQHAAASTIVDVSQHPPRLVRVGELIIDQLVLET